MAVSSLQDPVHFAVEGDTEQAAMDAFDALAVRWRELIAEVRGERAV